VTLQALLTGAEEFGLVSASAFSAAAAAEGVAQVAFFDDAISLLGDIVDPFLPGGAGSELRSTAFGGDVTRQNRARRAAGLPPIATGRRRRRKALTADDIRTALVIASAISKKAAENFILSRTAAS